MAASELESPLRVVALPSTVYTREVGIIVRVSSDASKLPRLPILGDTYASAAICQTRMSEFANYICTSIEGSGNYLDVGFSLNKTAAQALVPYKAPSSRFGNLFWPTILLDVKIIETKLGRSVNTGQTVRFGKSYEAIPTWIPSVDTGTLFILRQMLSTTEPDIPQHHTYHTRSVSFPVVGGRYFSFGENIGPELNIAQMQAAVQSYDVATAIVSGQLGLVGPYNFKATDPKTWAPYFLYDRAQKTATGSYLREQMEVIPPNLPPRQSGFR